MVIYVVSGQTGEYSDGREWMVKAFKEEEKAKNFVVEADRQAAEFYAKYGQGPFKYPYKRAGSEEEKGTEADPNIQCDYTGTTYFYGSVELD